MNGLDHTSLRQPRKVPAIHGWHWIRQAFFLIREQPLTWILYAAIYLLIQLLVGKITVVGPLAGMIAVPLFCGGFVMAADRAARGETLRIGQLFDGFRRYPHELAGLGLAYLGLLVAGILLISLLFGGPEMLSGQHAAASMPVGKILAGMGLVFMAMLAATLLYWFAPALVVQQGLRPWPAMVASLQAGLANTGAILFCGISLALLMLLAMLPWGLGLPLWLPLMFVSIYTAWQDVFGMPPAETDKA